MSKNHHIPPEVVTEILCRVSPWDARKFRCVSKQWLAIIDSRDIIQRQLRRSTALFLLLQAESESEPNLHRVEPSSLIPTTPNLIPKPYPTLPSHRRLSFLFGSCRGLLCFCSCQLDSKYYDLFILNPATHESRVVSQLAGYLSAAADDLTWYGFGYDQESGDYKAVVLLREISVGGGVGTLAYMGIDGTTGAPYCSGAGTTYDYNTYVPLGHQKMGVHLGGALHWFAVKEFLSPPCSTVLLIAHDLRLNPRIDKFRELGQPDYGREDGPCEKTVGVLDSCLCVCASYGGGGAYGVVDIWVMKEYGEQESWCRLYSMVNDPVLIGAASFVLPLGKFRGDGGQILMLVDRNKLVWYDPLKQSANLVPVFGLENYGINLKFKLEALGCLEIPCESFI